MTDKSSINFTNDFDIAVIGSSPMMLLLAMKYCAEGKKVILFEKDSALGGAWKVGQHHFNNIDLLHECACHLIEWQAGGYQYLEQLSGYPFVMMDPQPVKIRKYGRVQPYIYRRAIIRDYLFNIALTSYSVLRWILAKHKLINTQISIANLKLKSSIYSLREKTIFDFPGIYKFDGLKAPKGGYAKFVTHLIDSLHESEVNLCIKKVYELNRKNEGWSICTTDQSVYRAKNLVVSESTYDLFVNKTIYPNNNGVEYTHLLISLPACVVKIRSLYVHFSDSDMLHRITYVDDVIGDDGEQTAFFLLQTRSEIQDPKVIKEELKSLCAAYPIATDLSNLKIVKYIKEKFIASRFDSELKDLNNDGIVVVPTIGDLSRNLMRYKKNRKVYRDSF